MPPAPGGGGSSPVAAASVLKPSRAPLLLAILLAGFNLRIAIVGVGPLVDEVRTDLDMSSTLAGGVTTIPVLAMALFGIVGGAVVVRAGATAVVVWSLLVLGVSSALRAVMPTGALLLLLTVPLSVAIALMGVALPAIVKRHFDARGGGVTGLYAASLNFGAALAGLGAVHLARATGGWRGAFAVFALPAAVALPVWVRRWIRRDRVEASPVTGLSLGRPSRIALLMAAIFGCQSLAFYAVITWVAVVYLEAGWSPEQAAATTGALMLIAVPAAAILPGLTDHRGRRLAVAVASGLSCFGAIGLALATTELAWLWITAFAVGTGSMFPLSMSLPLDVADDEAEVSRLVGWTLGLGYCVSAAGPVGVGALRDLTGDFTLALLLVAVVAALPALLALAVPRQGERLRPGQVLP